MTKPCNFPERVNQRRKDALARISDRPYASRSQDIAALQALIVDSARDVKTKKYRGRSEA